MGQEEDYVPLLIVRRPGEVFVPDHLVAATGGPVPPAVSDKSQAIPGPPREPNGRRLAFAGPFDTTGPGNRHSSEHKFSALR